MNVPKDVLVRLQSKQVRRDVITVSLTNAMHFVVSPCCALQQL
jgi:hypothetical protein